VSDEKPGREDDARDAELTDEQLDREAPGVDDAGELEAAEDELAAEAEADEDKVVASPARRRGGRITAGDDDEEPTATRSRRVARSATPARAGGGTRSRWRRSGDSGPPSLGARIRTQLIKSVPSGGIEPPASPKLDCRTRVAHRLPVGTTFASRAGHTYRRMWGGFDSTSSTFFG